MMSRIPRSYLVMLSNFKTGIVSHGSVDSLDGVFEVALARAEKITLGTICADVVVRFGLTLAERPRCVACRSGLT